MQVAAQKLECLNQWIQLILPSASDLQPNDGLLPLQLIDLVKSSQLAQSTSASDRYNVALGILSEFYQTDVYQLLKPTKDGNNFSLYGQCCLLLLVLSMGLRLKCKVIMSAAFNLPSCMHYCVVELTQPLIDDSALTLSSFGGLNIDPENQPLTPIQHLRLMKAPVTCPPGRRQPVTFSTRFGRSDATTSSLIAEENRGFGNECLSPILSTPRRFAELRQYTDKRLNATQPVSLGVDTIDMADSPLHSLNTILDSPNLIPKAEYLVKLEEARQLSTELAEVRHLYEVTSSDLDQLNAAYQNSELQRKEAEVRSRRQEAELNDLRDELAHERESRIHWEQAARNMDRLRERLNSAREELKSLSRIKAENQELHKELSELRPKVKRFEELWPHLSRLQIVERQASRWKESLSIAEDKIMQLIAERERALAASEAEVTANWHRMPRPHSQEPFVLSPFSETPLRLSSSQPTRTQHSSPDSSQPGLEVLQTPKPFEFEPHESVDQAATHSVHTPGLCSAENLASVVAVNSHLQELEISVIQTKEELASTRALYVRQQCRTIAAQALAHRRLDTVRRLQAVLETLRGELVSSETLNSGKFSTLNEQVSSLCNRIEAAELELQSLQQARGQNEQSWSARVSELQAQLEESRMSNNRIQSKLEEHLRQSLETEQRKDEELKKLQQLFDAAGRNADKKLEDIERQASIRQHALETENAQLTQSLKDALHVKECIEDKLAQQLRANEAYRKAAEEELDQLRSSLSTLSASTSNSLTEQALEHRLVQERLKTEIAQLKQLNEDSSRYAARLQTQLDKAQTEASAQSQQLKDALALAESRKNELANLRTDNSQTRIRLLELEDQCTDAQDRVKQLQQSITELETRLSVSDAERIRTEGRCTRLASQTTELESELQQKTDRIRELQSSLDVAQQERSDFERRLTVLREQLRQVEADWIQSRDQLAQTRTALTQAVQLQHETSLQLMRSNFSYAQATERLALAQANEQNNGRAVRSALALFPHSRSASVGERSMLTDVPPLEESTIFDEPITKQLRASSSLMATGRPENAGGLSRNQSEFELSNHCTRSTSDNATPEAHREEVAVQTCSFVARQDAQVSCSVRQKLSESQKKSILWPPYADTTAPISPNGLRNKEVYSGASTQHHFRRFCRLIIAPDEDQPSVLPTDLLSRPIPHLEMVDEAISCSSKENRSPLERSESAVTAASEPNTMGDLSELSTQMSATPITYIPETPLPWNATSTSHVRSFSAHELAKHPVTVQVQTPRHKEPSSTVELESRLTNQPTRQHSWDHTPRFQSHKISRLWKARRLRKRSHRSQETESVDNSCTDHPEDCRTEEFRKPPPPPLSSALKLAHSNRDNIVTDVPSTSDAHPTSSFAHVKSSKWHGIFSKPPH